MTEFPEIERLRAKAVALDDPYGYSPDYADRRMIPHEDLAVALSFAERAVRDAVERCQNPLASSTNVVAGNIEQQARQQAVRECVEALRENARLYGDPMYTALMNAADLLARTMLGGEDAP
jgi:hypothetical protein